MQITQTTKLDIKPAGRLALKLQEFDTQRLFPNPKTTVILHILTPSTYLTNELH